MSTSTDTCDVLIVGAGLSGVGAAAQLLTECPGKSVVVLEARNDLGGTWDLFRYPGVRSDSDMFTLGYRFRPWTEAKAIADGPDILQYIHDTATEFGVSEHIRFQHRVRAAEWDSATARWSVEVELGDSKNCTTISCGFLYVCSGYYRYDEGFTPQLPGIDQFAGPVVHPQHWPEDLDYANKRVVVIGSGATAITLVPNLAKTAAHVTMLQRSPTYLASAPSRNRFADRARAWLPSQMAYAVVRWKNALQDLVTYRLSRRYPGLMKHLLRSGVRKQLPPGYPVDTHFAPRYNPWDQRICLAPDGDVFAALREGRASIMTDHIDHVSGTGIKLRSGAVLDADVIVTATGLNLSAIGGITLTVDGRQVDLSETVSYKGMMLSAVPNFVWTVGYTNASWTLKADLVAEYVCRLLKHMDAHRYSAVTPDPTATTGTTPFIDLASGYVTRSAAELPKQGERPPWRLHQNYVKDIQVLRRGPLDDEVTYTTTPVSSAHPASSDTTHGTAQHPTASRDGGSRV
ncbi:flavin-containing monooxygenase [Mycobacterium sp. BMJ-28]